MNEPPPSCMSPPAIFFLLLSRFPESSPFSYATSLLFIQSSLKYDSAWAPTNPQKLLIDTKVVDDFLIAKASGKLTSSYLISLRYLASLSALLLEIL